MKINVTQADIDKANKLNNSEKGRVAATHDCPICFSLKRSKQAPDPVVHFKIAWLDSMSAKGVELPKKAETAQKQWVKTGKMEPFSFELGE